MKVSYGKRLAIIDLCEGLWSVGGTHFTAIACSRSSNKKKTGYVTLFHCLWSSGMILNM